MALYPFKDGSQDTHVYPNSGRQLVAPGCPESWPVLTLRHGKPGDCDRPAWTWHAPVNEDGTAAPELVAEGHWHKARDVNRLNHEQVCDHLPRPTSAPDGRELDRALRKRQTAEREGESLETLNESRVASVHQVRPWECWPRRSRREA